MKLEASYLFLLCVPRGSLLFWHYYAAVRKLKINSTYMFHKHKNIIRKFFLYVWFSRFGLQVPQFCYWHFQHTTGVNKSNILF